MTSGGERERAPDAAPPEPFRRLFLALWPDEALRVLLAERIHDRLPAGAGRRVPVGNLHMTLVFLGAVAESRLPCIEHAAGAVRCAPFTLTLDHMAWWRTPQVLWLGPEQSPPALDALVQALRAALAGCGFAPDPRPFRAHMTLMRRVSRRPRLACIAPLEWRADGVTLIESIPADGGVRYRPRAFWPFG